MWRHEFGHIIDQQIGRKIQKSGYGGVRTSYFSTIAAKEILNDRKNTNEKKKIKAEQKHKKKQVLNIAYIIPPPQKQITKRL